MIVVDLKGYATSLPVLLILTIYLIGIEMKSKVILDKFLTLLAKFVVVLLMLGVIFIICLMIHSAYVENPGILVIIGVIAVIWWAIWYLND